MDSTASIRQAAILITTHLDSLVARTLQIAVAQVPWYHNFAEAELAQMFRRDYQALAEVLGNNNMAALRTYVEQTGMARIAQGASAPELITIATLLEAGVSHLIATEMGTASTQAAEATRRVQMVIKNMRMILSGINLRLLTHVNSSPPR
jgi:hypothetical protein